MMKRTRSIRIHGNVVDWLVVLAAGLVCLPLICGCQRGITTDYHKLDLVNVSGKITIEGEPLRGASVMFQSTDNADFSIGRTDETGRYQMMFNSEKPGVLAGNQIVRIRKRRFSENDYISFRNSILNREAQETTVNTAATGDEGESVASDFESTNGGPVPQTSDSKNGELHAAYHRDGLLQVNVQPGMRQINFDLKSDGSTTGPSGD